MNLLKLTPSQITLVNLLQNCYGVILLHVNSTFSFTPTHGMLLALTYLRDEIQKEIDKLEAPNVRKTSVRPL